MRAGLRYRRHLWPERAVVSKCSCAVTMVFARMFGSVGSVWRLMRKLSAMSGHNGSCRQRVSEQAHLWSCRHACVRVRVLLGVCVEGPARRRAALSAGRPFESPQPDGGMNSTERQPSVNSIVAAAVAAALLVLHLLLGLSCCPRA